MTPDRSSLGLAGALLAAWRENGAARLNWLIVGGFVAIGLVTSLWQVRALSSASALAIFGGAWIVARSIDWAARRASLLARLVPFALGLPFCSIFWAAVAPPQTQSDAVAGSTSCRAPATVGALAALPTSILMAPIDMGSDIEAICSYCSTHFVYTSNLSGPCSPAECELRDLA